MNEKSQQEIDAIYQFMQEYAVKEAGPMLMRYRGKVTNKPKDDLRSAGSDQKGGGLALTVVDEMIQEGFLWGLHKLSPEVRINCEEDTPLRELFRGNTGITVHQDPCDGTKPYLSGEDNFATGYGISDAENNFTHTVIFAPARNRLYVACPEESLVLTERMEALRETTRINHKKIFSKRALNERGITEAEKLGLEVKGVESAHCRIIDVALKNAGAYLYGKANPHDSFVPYAFAARKGATLTDKNGTPIDGRNIVVRNDGGLPVFVRVPSVVYMAKDFPYREQLMNIISDKKNLDADFLTE